MSLLNRPSDGLLSVLIALYRAAIGFGRRPETELLRLVAPQSIVPDGKADMARKTLTRWKQLGFFHEEGGFISLSADIKSIPSNDFNAFRGAVLRLLLLPSNNPAVQEVDSEGSRASDCTRAIAWALAQDAYSFPATYRGVESLQHDQNVQPKIFTNDTRWGGFAEWAVFLGIGYEAAKLPFVPCPAFAVTMVLPDVFSDKSELQQSEFFGRLATYLPVVDGGSYRQAVEAQIKRPWRIQPANETSLSLSAALLSLEAQGILRLEMRSDAPSRMLLGRGGRELRPVSHFIRQAAK
jgi:hypothetical protein